YCLFNFHVLHSFPTRRSSDLIWLLAFRIPTIKTQRKPIMFVMQVRKTAPRRTLFQAALLACSMLFAPSVFSQDFPTKQIRIVLPDRKSTRLNSSHVKISYAVF